MAGLRGGEMTIFDFLSCSDESTSGLPSVLLPTFFVVNNSSWQPQRNAKILEEGRTIVSHKLCGLLVSGLLDSIEASWQHLQFHT